MCETKRETWREKKKEDISNQMSKFTKDVGIRILILVRGSLCLSQNMVNSDFLSLF